MKSIKYKKWLIVLFICGNIFGCNRPLNRIPPPAMDACSIDICTPQKRGCKLVVVGHRLIEAKTAKGKKILEVKVK